MTCPHCRRQDCSSGSPTQCWESMLAESLPVSQVLSLLRANRQQQEAAAKRKGGVR